MFKRTTFAATLALALAGTAPDAAADYGWWQSTGYASQPQLKQTLSDLLVAGTDIREMAATVGGGWVIITDEAEPQVLFGGPVPTSCIAKIFEYIQSGRQIDCVAFTPQDGWCVIAEDLAWHSGLTSWVPELEAAILDRIGAGERLTELVFDTDGAGFTLLSNGGRWAHSQATNAGIFDAVYERHAHDRAVQRIQMDYEGGWVVLAEDWFASDGIDVDLFDTIKDCQRLERSMDSIMLGPPNGAWVLFSHGAFKPDFKNPMQAIEYGLEGFEPDGTNTSNIWQRMQDLDVAGVSLGVIENNRLRWARGYGVLENGTQRWVRTDSPFDTASVSKGVAAMMFMDVDDDPAYPALHLDTNVKQAALAGSLAPWNDMLIWAWYAPLFTGEAQPYTQLTLRRLLSHSAATVPHGSTAFFPGSTPPTTLEILFGADWSGGAMTYGGGNMPRYQSDLFSDGGYHEPGEVYKYSGGGFMLAQSMVETITDSNFHVLMQQRVLGPLQMADSTFVQPLPPGFEDRVALPHDSDAVVVPENSRPYYPWEAAGGLYSTPTDLSEYVLTLMGYGLHPDHGSIISFQSAASMLTKQTPVGDSKRYGLGLNLSDDTVTLFDDEWFAHDGGHSGASAYIAGSPGRGEGFVILINGGHDDADTLRNEIYNAFKDVYDWN